MPCGCFGKKKKKATDEPQKVPPPTEVIGGPSNNKGIANNNKNRDSDIKDEERPLLGYRPPSSYVEVDSPTSNSHTPSTIPAASASSSGGSSPSAPHTEEEATSRSLLAQKRREFFRDLAPDGRSAATISAAAELPTTLPTVARARQFGKVRNMRPVSQPTPSDPPVPEAPPPPGPHLLHSPRPSSAKTDAAAKGSGDESGFSSPEFLSELKHASDEIARRWGLSDEEEVRSGGEEALPPALKMRQVTHETWQETTTEGGTETDANSLPATVSVSHTTTSTVTVDTFAANTILQSPSGVPETLVTPPSPPLAESPHPQEEFPHSHPDSPSPPETHNPTSSVVPDYTRHHNGQSEKEYVGFLVENETSASTEAVPDEDFDEMLKKISSLEEGDSFDLTEEPLLEGGSPPARGNLDYSFSSPRTEREPVSAEFQVVPPEQLSQKTSSPAAAFVAPPSGTEEFTVLENKEIRHSHGEQPGGGPVSQSSDEAHNPTNQN